MTVQWWYSDYQCGGQQDISLVCSVPTREGSQNTSEVEGGALTETLGVVANVDLSFTVGFH